MDSQPEFFEEFPQRANPGPRFRRISDWKKDRREKVSARCRREEGGMTNESQSEPLIVGAQTELFGMRDAPAPNPARRIFHGANGVELPYWEDKNGKIIRFELSDAIAIKVTNPKGGNIRAR